MPIDWTFKPWDAIISLLGIGVAGYIGYKSARQTAAHESRNLALAKFRAIFVSTLLEVESLGSYKGLYDLAISLQNQLPKQREAFENFRFFIIKDSGTYQSSWDEYISSMDLSIRFPNLDRIRLADDSPYISTGDSRKEREYVESTKTKIINSIRKIISSAESCSKI